MLTRFRRWPISTKIWGDPNWTCLTIEAQLVGIFLMTYRTGGPWPAARIVRWTGWDRDMVEEAMRELRHSSYAEYVQTEPRRRRMSKKISRAVFARDGHTCLACGTSDRLTVDHILPVSKGGADDLDNLQTLCHSCNARKGARVEDSFDQT